MDVVNLNVKTSRMQQAASSALSNSKFELAVVKAAYSEAYSIKENSRTPIQHVVLLTSPRIKEDPIVISPAVNPLHCFHI